MSTREAQVSFRKAVALAVAGLVLLILTVTPGIILAGGSDDSPESKVVTSSTKVKNPRYPPPNESISRNEGEANRGQSREGTDGRTASSIQGDDAEEVTSTIGQKGQENVVGEPNLSDQLTKQLKFDCRLNKTTCKRGETITVTLSLTNQGNQPIKLTFSDSSLGFDGVIFPKGGSEADPVCRLNDGLLATQLLIERVLAPGESVGAKRLIPPSEQAQNNGGLNPGSYYLVGYSEAGSFRSQPIAFIVTP